MVDGRHGRRRQMAISQQLDPFKVFDTFLVLRGNSTSLSEIVSIDELSVPLGRHRNTDAAKKTPGRSGKKQPAMTLIFSASVDGMVSAFQSDGTLVGSFNNGAEGVKLMRVAGGRRNREPVVVTVDGTNTVRPYPLYVFRDGSTSLAVNALLLEEEEKDGERRGRRRGGSGVHWGSCGNGLGPLAAFPGMGNIHQCH